MRQPSHLDRRAGRKRLAENLVPDLRVLEELIDVGDVGRGLHEVLQPQAGRLERDPEIFTDLPDLRAHVALADDAPLAVARQLAGNEHQRLSRRDHDMRIERVALERAPKQALGLDPLGCHVCHPSML